MYKRQDLEAAKAKSVKVSNAAGYSNEAVSELVLCMMLALLRNVPQVCLLYTSRCV